MVRSIAVVVALAACGGHGEVNNPGPDASPADVDAASPVASSTLSAELAVNTSASPLFVDDYRNYNMSAQTGNGNGDLVPRAISKVPLATLVPGAQLFVETQTWFCHLMANEAGARLAPNARCGSHIDVGYNSDDPAHVARMVTDIQSRGLAGVIMDWSGKDASHDGNATFYPTATATDHMHARGSTEIGTNSIYAMKSAAEALAPGAFWFAVSEDEGITNCRKGWGGGCACWPAYGTACNETTQVISDLSYIDAHWAQSPAYLKIGSKAVVTFFAPDYNACPNPAAADCQHIDWTAVQRFVGDQVWIFENKGGYAHAFSGGGFNWLGTTLYPGSDPSFGVNNVKDYDAFVLASGHVGANQHIVASAFKGFDDGVTDGWNYGDGSHTRYIEQRCGLTWLATLAQVKQDFVHGVEMLQLVTWDDYEEATELETGIDPCVTSIDAHVSGTQLTWSVAYGKDLTNHVMGSEDTIDHVTIWASPDGEQLFRIGPDLVRDASGALPHSLELAALPPGTTKLFVQAIGKPFLANAMSAPIPLP
ncbi:MAG: hypothetical protein JWO36_4959 [Myxococcales bacterium]|nr:hypothetical protein [Myxococcales bacterium]